MMTGLKGTFVISWAQTELDGTWSAPLDTLRVGASWTWTGEPVRVDGPNGVLPLGEALGEADLRRRAAQGVRRILRQVDAVSASPTSSAQQEDPLLSDRCFSVTNGRTTWVVTLIPTVQGRPPLLMFLGDMPPRHSDLFIVSHNIDIAGRDQAAEPPGGVICFTPGTNILRPDGLCPVEYLREGDMVQTKDNGPAEILWIGRRRITGARLMAMPHLAPIRLLEGALDRGVPDSGLLVSPDHRMILRGPKAHALFNCHEVLVTARDLVNDRTVLVDRAVKEVNYIHILLESHQIVFANSVETESFHPASAAMDDIGEDARRRMFERLPALAANPQAYGGYARRILSRSEAALIHHDGARMHRAAAAR